MPRCCSFAITSTSNSEVCSFLVVGVTLMHGRNMVRCCILPV